MGCESWQRGPSNSSGCLAAGTGTPPRPSAGRAAPLASHRGSACTGWLGPGSAERAERDTWPLAIGPLQGLLRSSLLPLLALLVLPVRVLLLAPAGCRPCRDWADERHCLSWFPDSRCSYTAAALQHELHNNPRG